MLKRIYKFKFDDALQSFSPTPAGLMDEKSGGSFVELKN